MPMAISGVCAALIWKFMYWYQLPGLPQTGVVNEALTKAGQSPIPFLIDSDFKIATFALIFIMIWMWTGFGTVILSASLKSISPELLEAARVDGASEWQVFRKITFPLLEPDDRSRLDHDDHHGPQGLRPRLHADGEWVVRHSGHRQRDVQPVLQLRPTRAGSAIAVVLLLAIVPVMLFNIRRFQFQEGIR